MTATDKPAPLAGVVLAAGASPWEGRAKALKQVRDGHVTAVEHVVSIVAARCEPVFVVTSPGQSVPNVPAQVVRDDVRGHGQLSAVGRGLRAAAEAGAAYAFLCSVDAELLDPDTIDVLAARAAALNVDIVLPWDGENHYLAAVYRTELATVVDDLVAAGERDLSALILRSDTQRVIVAGDGSHTDAVPVSGVA